MAVADLKIWFNRPYPTVRNWVLIGAAPYGPRGESMLAMLGKLETAIKKKQGFPVPADISHFDRPAYIKKLTHARDRVHKRRSTK